MKITNNNITFTDNTDEITSSTIFVQNKLNSKYIDIANQKSPKQIIDCKQLIKYFDFSTIKIVGITGTNGKTTTAAAIYSILLDLGYNVALLGTRGFFINDVKVKDYSFTTPMQIELYSDIQFALEKKCQFFIMEVSSHAIAQDRISGLKFALKIHTNITSDHLDYHKTSQEYIYVKNSFFKDDTMKLINKDDKNIKINLKNAYSYGLDNPSTYKVQAYSFKEGTNVILQKLKETISFNSDLRGIFNIYNLVAAFASVDLLTQKKLTEIASVIPKFGGVSGRMETVSLKPYIVIDFAHTYDGMKVVFESFKDKNIIVLFGAGGDRDKTKRPLMGKIATQYAKYIYLTSDNPRFEDPDSINKDILKGIENYDNVTVELNRKLAIHKAIQKVQGLTNSVLLILGKGDEQDQTIYDRKIPFNDKEIVLDYLNLNLP